MHLHGCHANAAIPGAACILHKHAMSCFKALVACLCAQVTMMPSPVALRCALRPAGEPSCKSCPYGYASSLQQRLSVKGHHMPLAALIKHPDVYGKT